MDERTVLERKLFRAVENNEPDEIRNLLRQGADVAAKDEHENTVLHLAASKGRENVVQVLIGVEKWKEIVNIEDAVGQTALHNCCIPGHTRTIELLLENGANVAVTDQAGRTALHHAADQGRRGAIELLLKNGADLTTTDQAGWTALHHASHKGHTGAIKFLLENGADATVMDQEGWTALHHAADEGHLAAVRRLVEHMKEHKMDLNLKTNKTGGTALHIAADRGFAGIVDDLMSNGANSTTKAWDVETVLHWALEGAIAARHDFNGEDESEDGFYDDNNVNEEEAVNFGRPQEERAEDTPYQYDAVFERIVRDMNGKAKWSELLKFARREERMETLQYLMRMIYSRHAAERFQTPLTRIWLAMNEARTQDLMEMLWAEAREARNPELVERLRTEARDTTDSMDKWDSLEKWDILSLATSLGKVQIVYWLLRGRHWSRSDKDKARNLPDYDRLNKNATLSTDGDIWSTPIIHDERRGRERYRWPENDSERRKLDRFESTIMDFHRIDNQIVSIYYDFDTSRLMDENHGPRNIVERSMRILGIQEFGEMVRSKYSDASRCYRWIHLTINSVPWMKNLAMISYLEKKARKGEWMATWQFLRRSWQELPDNRDEQSYMHPKCLRENIFRPKLKPGDQSATPKHDESMRMALYMPYLTIGPFKNTPHDEDVPEEYKGGVLHRSRTLDQFYHSIQDDKRVLDRDQVFTRFSDRYLCRERNNDDTEFDILRVNQLWLWVIDEKTVISSTTHGLQESEDPMFQELLKRLCQSQTMFNRETTPSSIDSFVKLITSFLINSLDNLKVSFKVSSAQARRENPDGVIEVDQDRRLDSTKTYTASLTTVFADSIERNNAEERSLRQAFKKAMNDKTSRSSDLHSFIVRAMNALDDIKDIRHELNIINSVVQEQKSVWTQLCNQSHDSSTRDDAPKESHGSYPWSNTDPDYVSKRVRDLLHDAEETERNITSVLELEMNQLNVSEAEETRKQGEILMAFTLVTAVFLPLSFLASLFALNVSTFPHSEDEVQYQPGWIFGIMFGTALAFTLTIFLFTVFREAFFGTITEVMKKLQKLLPKASPPTELQRDENKPTAEENGHEGFKKRWQELSGRRRREKPGGEAV